MNVGTAAKKRYVNFYFSLHSFISRWGEGYYIATVQKGHKCHLTSWSMSVMLCIAPRYGKVIGWLAFLYQW